MVGRNDMVGRNENARSLSLGRSVKVKVLPDPVALTSTGQ